jgi:hypothetical protein
MTMRRMWAAGAAIVVCLTLGGLPALGQETSPAGGQGEVLYEITVPEAAIPDAVWKIVADEWTVAPGTDVTIPHDNEGILGRGMFVESGQLAVTPAYDALLWTGEAAQGGSPATVPAGQPVSLAVGDLLLVPAIPREELDPAAEVGIANAGTDPAVVFAFHMHWWENFPGWPAGIRSAPGVTFVGRPELERAQAGDTTFRLTKRTAPPGNPLSFPQDAAIVFDYLKSGTIGIGERTRSVPGTGSAFATEPDPPMAATSDGPAEVLELAVIPSVETIAPEVEASTIPVGSTWVTGTAACAVTTNWSTTIVDGVEQLRGRVADCEWFASDPRMSGPFSITQDMDCYELTSPETGRGCVLWATFEGSGWTGSLITPVDSAGIGTDHIIQTGTGANAGLTFVGTNTPDGWSGLLYEGDPPPMGPQPSPASE